VFWKRTTCFTYGYRQIAFLTTPKVITKHGSTSASRVSPKDRRWTSPSGIWQTRANYSKMDSDLFIDLALIWNGKESMVKFNISAIRIIRMLSIGRTLLKTLAVQMKKYTLLIHILIAITNRWPKPKICSNVWETAKLHICIEKSYFTQWRAEKWNCLRSPVIRVLQRLGRRTFKAKVYYPLIRRLIRDHLNSRIRNAYFWRQEFIQEKLRLHMCLMVVWISSLVRIIRPAKTCKPNC